MLVSNVKQSDFFVEDMITKDEIEDFLNQLKSGEERFIKLFSRIDSHEFDGELFSYINDKPYKTVPIRVHSQRGLSKEDFSANFRDKVTYLKEFPSKDNIELIKVSKVEPEKVGLYFKVDSIYSLGK